MESSGRDILYRGDTVLAREVLPEYPYPVVTKRPAGRHPSAWVLESLETEYAMAQTLEDVVGVRRVLGRQSIAGIPELILEYVNGETLREHVASNKPDLRARLEIAIQLARILEKMHGRGYAHLALSGDNILIDKTDRAVHFIDLGASIHVAEAGGHKVPPDQPLGNLGYISPEQTGRVNRAVDERSDLYSLGVVLYELMSGHLPFPIDDAIKLVHHHIALPPDSLSKISPDVPVVVGSIISKLLRKDSDDRYQSAVGVRTDLEECLRRLDTDDSVAAFELAEKDRSSRLVVPQHLYGRERELDELVGLFADACRQDSTLVLVSGYSGVGKTSLVEELQRSVAESGGIFIRGKFDQYLRTTPFSAMTEAFSALVSWILTLPEGVFAARRERIQAAVGDLGKVLTEIMPGLEDVIGPQPDAPQLGGQEAENRFRHVFGEFLHAVATPEHPLVLFIDDLHWIDPASLGLLAAIRSGREGPGLLVVGAHRDNEVEGSHPLAKFIDESDVGGMPLRRLELANLDRRDLEALLSDTLGTRNGVDKLSATIYSKTGGNPFFVRRLLALLDGADRIRFDAGKQGWTWDLKDVAAQAVPENVADLLAQNLGDLPAESRDVLALAACIGNRFDPATLALISGRDESELSGPLSAAANRWFVRATGDAYEFVHDQVQQAALRLIDPRERSHKHLELARLLLAGADESELDDRVFDIVTHFNLSTELIADRAERIRVAELNLRAARRSRTSSAFSAAVLYLEQGLELLGEEPWQNHYELALEIHDALIDARYLEIEYDEVATLFDTMRGNATRDVDLWGAYRTMIMTLVARNRSQDAITLAEDYLEKLGVTLDEERTSDLSAEELLALPRLEDETQSAAMEILMAITTPVVFSAPERAPALFSTMLNIMSKYGNCEISSFATAWYATLLCMGEKYEEGLAFGQLAADLLDRYPSPGMATRVVNMHNVWIRHWVDPVHDLIGPLKEFHRVGLEAGEFEWCLYCLVNHTLLLWGTGRTLGDYLAEAGTALRLCENKGQEITFLIGAPFAQAAANLIGGTDCPSLLEGEWFSETDMLPGLEGSNMVLSFFGVAKLTLATLFDQPQEAYRQVSDLLGTRMSLSPHYLYTKISFYGALACIAGRADGAEDAERRERLAGFERELRLWAGLAPVNYLHQLDLVLAERARAENDNWLAVRRYGKAIQGARENRFVHDEALANELCGRFWLDHGDEQVAAVYLQEARRLYGQWGAIAKVSHLERNHPQLLEAGGGPEGAPDPAPVSLAPARIDELSLIEASQALSSETDLGRLMIRMMKLVIASSGASVATLLLCREDEWFVQARADVGQEQRVLLLDLPFPPAEEGGNGMVPVAVFDSCRRSQKVLVVEDVQSDERFAADAEMADRHVRSLACLPVLHHGKLLAVLYMENRQMAAVFTPDRIEVLEHLSAQLGVSLENALLYNDLERRLRELQASEERYALAVAGSDAGLWDWDIVSGKIFYSDRFQELLGHKPGVFSDTLDEFWTRLHPEDVDAVGAVLDRHLANREIYSVDYRLRTEDGGYRWFHARGQAKWSRTGEPMRMSGSISDITVRKEIEVALARSEYYFRSLMEQFPLATEILTPDGRIERVNSAWRRLWDVDEAEAEQVLANYNMLTDEQLRERGLEEQVLEAFAGEAVILPPFQYDSNRTVKEIGLDDMETTAPWVQSHLSPVKDAEGNTLFVVNTYADITDFKLAEEESLRHQEALARVDRASSLGQLTGSIAHELNQPLTGILSNAQAAELMIASGQTGREELGEVMADIVSDTKRAGDVIRNLRDLYREQVGDFQLVNLNTIVMETTRLLRGEIVVRHVVLTMACDEGVLEVLGNRVQIQQVIVNLVMNAIQAVQDLDRDLRRVRITTTRRGGEIAVRVGDRGPGINAERIEHIFKPLATWKPGGTGMGLAISNAIIRVHGGFMTAENRPGGGACVSFTLPVPKEGE